MADDFERIKEVLKRNTIREAIDRATAAADPMALYYLKQRGINWTRRFTRHIDPAERQRLLDQWTDEVIEIALNRDDLPDVPLAERGFGV